MQGSGNVDDPYFGVVGQFEIYLPSGAKAPNHFSRFMYGLKPVPFKLTHYLLWGSIRLGIHALGNRHGRPPTRIIAKVALISRINFIKTAKYRKFLRSPYCFFHFPSARRSWRARLRFAVHELASGRTGPNLAPGWIETGSNRAEVYLHYGGFSGARPISFWRA